jgi:hypothetical protein
MDTLIHADIFFFVTTVAVVVFTIALTVFMVYLVRILRNVRRITDAIDEEVVLVRRDIGDLRSEVRARGTKAASALDWFGQFFGMTTKTSRSKKKSK